LAGGGLSGIGRIWREEGHKTKGKQQQQQQQHLFTKRSENTMMKGQQGYMKSTYGRPQQKSR